MNSGGSDFRMLKIQHCCGKVKWFEPFFLKLIIVAAMASNTAISDRKAYPCNNIEL
jgi:hypothetical protein